VDPGIPGIFRGNRQGLAALARARLRPSSSHFFTPNACLAPADDGSGGALGPQLGSFATGSASV